MTTLGVVSDGVASTKTDPLGNWAVLLHLLREDLLNLESLVGRHGAGLAGWRQPLSSLLCILARASPTEICWAHYYLPTAHFSWSLPYGCFTVGERCGQRRSTSVMCRSRFQWRRLPLQPCWQLIDYRTSKDRLPSGPDPGLHCSRLLRLLSYSWCCCAIYGSCTGSSTTARLGKPVEPQKTGVSSPTSLRNQQKTVVAGRL